MRLWGPARVSKSQRVKRLSASGRLGCFLSAGAHCDPSALASLAAASPPAPLLRSEEWTRFEMGTGFSAFVIHCADCRSAAAGNPVWPGPSLRPAAPVCLLSQQVSGCQRPAGIRWKCRNSWRRAVGCVFGSGILFPKLPLPRPSPRLVSLPPLSPQSPHARPTTRVFAALRLSTLA